MVDYLRIGIDVLVLLLPGFIGLLIYCVRVQQPLIHCSAEFLLVIATSKTIQYLVAGLQVDWVAEWADFFNLALSSLVAMTSAIAFGHLALMKDRRRRVARRDSSTMHSAPMRWGKMFRGERRHVLLHLKSGRDIIGWPEGWPHDPQTGHFFLINPRERGCDPKDAEPRAVAAVIPAVDVVWVELLESDRASSLDPDSIVRI